MNYTWYKIFNKAEFEATELVSKELTLILEDLGEKTFLVTQGNLLSLTVDDTMLSLGLKSDNPFVFNDRAIYIDASDNVFYGIPIDED